MDDSEKMEIPGEIPEGAAVAPVQQEGGDGQPLKGAVISEFGSYAEYKSELDREIMREVDGFVRIGYLLKLARDTNILQESGYGNLYEFAQKEYGLDASRVSRFININDRFSVGGYSPNLELKYKGYGVAKLAVMLTLPEGLVSDLSPEYSKNDIQTLRDEVRAEEAVSPLEVMMEQGDGYEGEGMVDHAMHQLFSDDPELFVLVYRARQEDAMDAEKRLFDILAPTGDDMRMVRIAGEGRVALHFNQKGVMATSLRHPEEKEWMPWSELDVLLEIHGCDGEDLEGLWEEIYKREFPGRRSQESVPSRPSESVGNGKTKRRVQKVVPAKVDGTGDAHVDCEKSDVQEEQIPGQDNIMNHTEWVPDAEEGSERSADVAPMHQDGEDGRKVGDWKTRHDGAIRMVEDRIHSLRRICGDRAWQAAKSEAAELIKLFEELIEMERHRDEE